MGDPSIQLRFHERMTHTMPINEIAGEKMAKKNLLYLFTINIFIIHIYKIYTNIPKECFFFFFAPFHTIPDMILKAYTVLSVNEYTPFEK